MASLRKSVRVFTTRLSAGECIDRLRRISETDDGDDSRHRNIFEPQSLLLSKTTTGSPCEFVGPARCHSVASSESDLKQARYRAIG
jgi:hypothetical protein